MLLSQGKNQWSRNQDKKHRYLMTGSMSGLGNAFVGTVEDVNQ